MMDHLGRVWFTARVRPFDIPTFCCKGSNHPSAKVFPMGRATRHVSFYDPNFRSISESGSAEASYYTWVG